MKLDRREFATRSALLAMAGMLGGLLPGRPAAAAAATQPRGGSRGKSIGIQTYSVIRDMGNDVPGTLRRLASIGFTHIELCRYEPGSVFGVPLAQFRRMVEDAGLRSSGSHAQPPLKELYEFGDGGGSGKGFRSIRVEKYTRDNQAQILDFWRRAVDDHAALGVQTLVQPALPVVESRDDVARVCEVFNRTGELARAAGIRWGYHNHSAEFLRVGADADRGGDKRYPGDLIYELLLDGTDPALVFFEMDVYWTVMAQCDPLDYFRRYPGRFPLLHIKDRAVIGASGMMNFANIFEAAYAQGLEWFYAELEPLGAGTSQIDAVSESYRYLAQAPFVR